MARPKTTTINPILSVTCAIALLTGCATEPTEEAAAEPAARAIVAPEIQMEGPVIYLADNLNEKEMLGWCIDTEGRGQSNQLQAHSCKPAGDDTQYTYDTASSTIRSVNYENQCMSFNDPENAVNPFGLVDCVDGDSKQKFVYDADRMEFRIGDDQSQCVTVAETIIEAGPYQSRDLIAATCEDLGASFKEWVVRD